MSPGAQKMLPCADLSPSATPFRESREVLSSGLPPSSRSTPRPEPAAPMGPNPESVFAAADRQPEGGAGRVKQDDAATAVSPEPPGVPVVDQSPGLAGGRCDQAAPSGSHAAAVDESRADAAEEAAVSSAAAIGDMKQREAPEGVQDRNAEARVTSASISDAAAVEARDSPETGRPAAVVVGDDSNDDARSDSVDAAADLNNPYSVLLASEDGAAADGDARQQRSGFAPPAEEAGAEAAMSAADVAARALAVLCSGSLEDVFPLRVASTKTSPIPSEGTLTGGSGGSRMASGGSGGSGHTPSHRGNAYAASSSSWSSPMCRFQPRGLVNTGNSCFINSTLQVGEGERVQIWRPGIAVVFVDYIIINLIHHVFSRHDVPTGTDGLPSLLRGALSAACRLRPPGAIALPDASRARSFCGRVRGPRWI